ncbi:MAG: divalent-cation tolerance protein CutA [Bacteroidia bacterium]|nr:divalent-cation tolerance protein CutA [Bacteroidia bacterium]
METPDFGIVYVVCGSVEEAESLAKLVLEHRLAACANIIPVMHSMYWWQGSLQRATETLLLLKAPYTYYEQIERLLKIHHSYEVPAIFQIPITQGLIPFLRWIAEETAFDY